MSIERDTKIPTWSCETCEGDGYIGGDESPCKDCDGTGYELTNTSSNKEATLTEAYLYEMARQEEWDTFIDDLREYFKLNLTQALKELKEEALDGDVVRIKLPDNDGFLNTHVVTIESVDNKIKELGGE